MEKSGKFRLTSLERNWILYDVGNSAFVLMVATLIPIFFNALAAAGGLSSVEYLAYWGYASSAVTVITAVLSPILGTVADTKGFKKPIFILCVFVGIVGCCAMGAVSAWLPFLVIFVIAKVGFSGSLVFYDSMLSDVTTPERMDEVSSRGYAWGYIGSCVPFVVCLGLVLGAGSIGIGQMTALNLALLLTAAWWLLTTLPLLKSYKQLYYVEVESTLSGRVLPASAIPCGICRRISRCSGFCWRSSATSTACTPLSTWRRPTARHWVWTPPAFCWHFL